MQVQCDRCQCYDDEKKLCDKHLMLDYYDWCDEFDEDPGKAMVLDMHPESNYSNENWRHYEPYLICLRDLKQQISKLNGDKTMFKHYKNSKMKRMIRRFANARLNLQIRKECNRRRRKKHDR